MEQESRAGCILHGCGVLAALAGLCAASGAACVFALTPGWRVWALPVFFLLALGLPVMVMEFSVGRASQKSIAKSFDVLEPKGSKWHFYKVVGIIGNYLLMMFYTTV